MERRVIEYIVGGAALLAYVAYHSSTPDRRRRWLARIQAPATPNGDDGDPLPSPLMDQDAGGHHHHDHGHDHGHGIDFDVGGHHH
jgi:hypothetical protein